MRLQKHQLYTIELLAKNEEKVAELYKVYSELFSEYREFWEDLVKDEIQHAAWIRDLRKRTEDGYIFFNENRFKIESINISLDTIREQIALAKNKKINETEALSVALELEKSLLEKSFFEIFDGDSSELKWLLKNLCEGTTIHKEKVEKALKKKK